jgi:hypothetical protein
MGTPRERRRDPGRFPYALSAENIRSPILYVPMSYGLFILSWYFPARLRQHTDDSLGVLRFSRLHSHLCAETLLIP